jgi:tripartite-type tricarboxylate transporter receptor subunit TctC
VLICSPPGNGADVQSGTIDFMIIDGTFGLGQIKAGRIKPLTVTTASRLSTLQGVSTMAEAGIPNYDFASWWAAWLPKGTPPEITARLEAWFLAITASAETREFLSGTAGTPLLGGSEVARARQLAEIEKMGSRRHDPRHRAAVATPST